MPGFVYKRMAFSLNPFVVQNIVQALCCHGNTDVPYSSQWVHELSRAPNKAFSLQIKMFQHIKLTNKWEPRCLLNIQRWRWMQSSSQHMQYLKGRDPCVFVISVLKAISGRVSDWHKLLGVISWSVNWRKHVCRLTIPNLWFHGFF